MMPIGSTFSELRSGTKVAAADAPTAIPSPVMPCMTAALESDKPRFTSAHLSTSNCSVTAPPHISVVTHSAICASLSAHSTLKQCVKSPTSFFGSLRRFG